MAIIAGKQITDSNESANFRVLLGMMYNSNVKKGKQRQLEQLWPLPTDYKESDLHGEDRFKLYEKILQNSKIGEC